MDLLGFVAMTSCFPALKARAPTTRQGRGPLLGIKPQSIFVLFSQLIIHVISNTNFLDHKMPYLKVLIYIFQKQPKDACDVYGAQ